MERDQLTHEIIDSAYKVHTKLGPGLLESAYRTCLAYELRKKGLKVEEEKPLPIIYEEIKLECGYRLDKLVENEVIVELNTVLHCENYSVKLKLHGVTPSNRCVTP